MHNAATSRPRLLLLLALFCLVIVTGCGKSGMPSPKKTQDTFTLTDAAITFVGDCLAARGAVSGAVANLETVTLELAPIQSYDDCPGCPFMAREFMDFSSADIQLDPQTGAFMLSYCPMDQAPMYRWRLVGKNVFPGLPYATTTPQVTSRR